MQTPEPLVSIIIPVYNLEDYLPATLDSVLAQRNHSRFEVLVVDDRSTDNTLNIVKSYAAKYPRIKILANHRQQGAAGARNTGLEHAQGEWITFLDGDDLWDENFLAEELAVLQQYPMAQFISCDFWVLRENNQKYLQSTAHPIWHKYFADANQTSQLLVLENPLSCFLNDDVITRTGVILITDELQRQAGFFDETLAVCEDCLYWITLAQHSDDMVYVPKPLMTYRQRTGSLTRNGLSTDLWDIIAYKKMLNQPQLAAFKKPIRKRIAKQATQITYYYRRQSQKRKALRSALESLSFDPYQFTAWKNLLAAILLR